MKRWGNLTGKSRDTAPTLPVRGFVRQDSSRNDRRIWRLDRAARPFILPRMFPVTINEAQLDWQAGPYDGVQLKILNRDEAPGDRAERNSGEEDADAENPHHKPA